MNVKKTKKQKLRTAEYYDMQDILDKLYEQSVNNKEFNKLMEIIVDEQNIKMAYRNLKKNEGSKTAGVDDKTIKYLSKWEDKKLIEYVQERLKNYVPQPIRRVEIPKENDPTKKRPLGIPTIMDRLIQQCILQILEPICEAKFHERSNGFRPNRDCENAIAQAEMLMQHSNMHYVVDIDIKGFFDNVSHSKLLKQMWTLGIQDKRLLCIISAMLKAEVAGIGFPEKGTPQGGIISPILSNIVLNELDWWVASQWEEIPTEKEYSVQYNKKGGKNKGSKLRALRKTSLKECYIVRYADDFKIFCRNAKDAKRLFEATKKWLRDRLGLEISPEKSKIVNLKKHYSEFLGFKMKVRRKRKKANGTYKYTIKAHIQNKKLKKIKTKVTEHIKDIQKSGSVKEGYKAVQAYNSYVLGVHNYYRIASHVSCDFQTIVFGVNRTLYNRLKSRLKRTGKPLPKHIAEKYGKSKQMRYVNGHPLIPIGYIQHKIPMQKKRIINNYTHEGRAEIHKRLDCIDMNILHHIMENPLPSRSIEYNDNRISRYAAQKGKCAVTGKALDMDTMECHHIIPIDKGGTDKYSNLTLIDSSVHILVHASNMQTIEKYRGLLRIDTKQAEKINKLRGKMGLDKI